MYLAPHEVDSDKLDPPGGLSFPRHGTVVFDAAAAGFDR